jgi:hypothetical protein
LPRLFASRTLIIQVQDISIEFSPGLGEFSNFCKISGPDEIGERLDDGIEILKKMASSLNRLENGTESERLY